MKKEWKLQRSKKAYQNHIKINQDTYISPDGKEVTFDIINLPHTVCILAIDKNQQVVLTNQFRPGHKKCLLEIPGGYINEDENPQKAAERELKEETGYSGKLEYITKCYDDGYSTMVRHCYVATSCTRRGEQKLDANEHIEVVLVSLDEFKKIIRSGQMTDVEVGFLGLNYLDLL